MPSPHNQDQQFKPLYEANAKLIEAAPALLDALRDVMPLLSECDCIHSDREAPLCPCRAARTLLEKVTENQSASKHTEQQ